MRAYLVVCGLTASLLPASTASPQSASLSLRLGRFAPRVESALWDENLETFAIESSDFDAFMGGAELNVALSEFLDLTVGVEGSSRTVYSNYRDFVRDDGTEVVQDLRLRIVPLTGGVRLLPLGRDHRARPYVGAGMGAYFYEYREEGEFIDFESFDIFAGFFLDRGIAYGGYVSGGLEVSVSDAVHLFGEFRKHLARGTQGGDFDGFGRFDLNATQVAFGVGVQF